MQAIILCGGLAARLGNITKKRPKILLIDDENLLIEKTMQMCERLQNLGGTREKSEAF